MTVFLSVQNSKKTQKQHQQPSTAYASATCAFNIRVVVSTYTPSAVTVTAGGVESQVRSLKATHAGAVLQSLPKHLRPLSDSTKPGGQMHWKPPGVLVQDPKRQMLGSSSHSLISAEQQEDQSVGLIKQNQTSQHHSVYTGLPK